jgi:uncharacterized paraquat-inducible protein A
MPIRFTCPLCSAPIRAKDEKAGQSANCPSCFNPILVPVEVHYEPVAREPPPSPVPPPAPLEAATTPAGTELTCTHCAHKFTSPAKAQGQQFVCPNCRSLFTAGVSKEKIAAANEQITQGLIAIIFAIITMLVVFGSM